MYSKYYASEPNGEVYDTTIDKTKLKSMKKNDHFVIENPTDEMIRENSFRLVYAKGVRYLLSDFTYDYYFGPQQTAIILFIKKDIFGQRTIITKKVNKLELFEIPCTSNAESTIKLFLNSSKTVFDIDENTVLEIKQIGQFSRCFRRKLINSEIDISSTIYTVTHEVMYTPNSSRIFVVGKNTFVEFPIDVIQRVENHIGDVTKKILMDFCSVGHKSTLETIKLLSSLKSYELII